MPMIRVNNAEFYYELHGQGEPVVFIAGYSGIGASWGTVVKKLAPHFQVLTFDNRGVGQTIDDGCELSAKLMADDTMLLCDALGLKNPHVIGRSMGGNIALAMAAYYPERIGKLGILVSSPKWHRALLDAFHVLIDMEENKVAFDIIFKSTMAWMLGNKSLNDDAFMSEIKDMMQVVQSQSIENQKRQLRVLQKFDGTPLLAKVKADTFIAYGNEDITARPSESKLMASQIKNSKLIEFDCAHLILCEAEAELSQALLKFLQSK